MRGGASGAEVSLSALAGGRSETGSGAVPSAAAQVAVLRIIETGARRVGSSGARRERRTASLRAVASSGAENGNLRDGTDGAVVAGGTRTASDGRFTGRVCAIRARSGSGCRADGCARVVNGGDGEGKSEERAVVAERAGTAGTGQGTVALADVGAVRVSAVSVAPVSWLAVRCDKLLSGRFAVEARAASLAVVDVDVEGSGAVGADGAGILRSRSGSSQAVVTEGAITSDASRNSNSAVRKGSTAGAVVASSAEGSWSVEAGGGAVGTRGAKGTRTG